ncbi:hypothetical protein GCM10010833_15910 [Blastomonas aquatica]|uniref:Uncharacterized protein n=1 Tax=Blastomonas aquatica TaxID=1510276 RepID=A0ABQ1J770_9SPHN|nr:hypothetical protein [Blastomonas aquatica]GGB61722.1 hypothetical protein GCM10010833_15910 [Blastomonas aquatica]
MFGVEQDPKHKPLPAIMPTRVKATVIVDNNELPRSKPHGHLGPIDFLHQERNQSAVDKPIIAVSIDAKPQPKSVLPHSLKHGPVKALLPIVVTNAKLFSDEIDYRWMRFSKSGKDLGEVMNAKITTC